MLFLIIGGVYLLAGIIAFVDLEIRARPHRRKPLTLGSRLFCVPLIILLWPMVIVHPLTRRWPKVK